MSRIALLLIDDGRFDYRDRCLASASKLLPPLDVAIEVNDPDHELGFAGAIQAGWDAVIESGADWVVHLESDFIFNIFIPIERMIRILEGDPSVVQVALKRQAWNPAERAAGGIVECDPDSYLERSVGAISYTVHRKFITTNPSVYRASLCERGWPQEAESEGKFGLRLFDENPDAVSAFLGRKFNPPLVEHIGESRKGNGY